MKTTDKPIKRTANARTPRRKLLATLTAAALLSLASTPQAHAAPPIPIPLLFAPVGDKTHPDELAFDIPLAAGESVTDIRYLENGAEASLMSAFELIPGTGCASARFLPKVDFSPHIGQTLTLKVIKTDGTFAAQSEEQLLLKIVSIQELQQDLKLVAVTDGTVQLDTLEFLIPGAINATLSDLLLVSAGQGASVKSAFVLDTGRSGNTLAGLRTLDLDPAAGQQLELSAVKTLKGRAAPLAQKLVLSPVTVAAFTQEATVTVPTSGDTKPDPFTFDLGGGANVEVRDIAIDLPGGAVSALDFFNITRAADGSLSARLKTDLDLDTLVGQAVVFPVQLSVADKSYTRKITLNPLLQDRPAQIDAPRLLSRDDANIAVESAISDADGVRSVLYLLYADAAGKTEIARNGSGAFANLSANSAYYLGTTAETLDRATKKWTAQKSPLLAVTTDQAMPAVFAFNPVSDASLGGQYTSNSITVSGLHSVAAVSVAGGEYSLDGGAWRSAAGTVGNGQSVQVRGMAASGYSTGSKVTLTIGGRSGDFAITTVAKPVVVVYYDPPASDTATTLAAPTLESKTATTINTAPGTFTDADGVQNVTTKIYSDAGFTALLGTDANGDFTGLSAATTYHVRTEGQAKNGATGAWESKYTGGLSVATDALADITAPTTSAHSVANVTDTTADIRATIDENGTGYYVVQLAATAAPSVAQIVAGQDGSGGAAPKSGNAAMTAATQKVFSVAGLTASTNYTAYFVAKDAANNTQAVAVSVANVTDTTADIRATIDENGTGYYIVQLAATAAPSVVQIVAGQDGSGAAAPKSGNAAMTAATQKVFSVSGLSAGANYTAYFVAKDAANNTQAAAVSDALNTAAADNAPPVKIGGFIYVGNNMTWPGTMTFNEPTILSGLKLVDASDGTTQVGTASASSGNGTTNVTLTITTPNAIGLWVKVVGYAADAAGNSGPIESAPWELQGGFDTVIPTTPTLSIKNGDAYVNKAYADANTTGGFIDVPVTITGDTDNVGVTGWFVSESSSVPVLGDFVTPKPGMGKVSTGDGIKTLYTWTRDATGNLSLAGSDTIIINTTPPAAPTGLALDGGAASTTAASVALGGLTTPADADLAAWFVSESVVAPAAGDAGWAGAKPNTYSFATATNETKTVCVYVKDTADNVQATGACDTINKVP